MNFSMIALSATKYTQKLSIGEALPFGLEMVLLGMGTVFGVLVILWAALSLFKVVFASEPKAKKVETPAPQVAAPAPVYSSNDEEIVAVIAAAIAMAESESDGTKFRVVSFKRK